MTRKRGVKREGGRGRLLALVAGIIAVAAVGGFFFFSSPITMPIQSSIPVRLDFPNRLGSESAPITILEFGEYQCPDCARFNKLVKETLLERYVDRGIAKMYFRDFPYYGPDSISAAIAARCAGEQGKYWEYHDLMYSVQGAIESGWADVVNLKEYAKGLVPDLDSFNACLDSERYTEEVRADFQEGLKRGVGGTPTFIIIGPDGREEVIVGAQPFSVFESVIELMLMG